MSVYLSMKFPDKVYTRIYWVYAYIYFYSWVFVLMERAHTRTYSYVWVHTMCNCFFLPAIGRPACILLARLHPAGALEFESSLFVAETRHICSRTNNFIIMSAAIGLASSCLLFGSSRAISSTDSASQRLRMFWMEVMNLDVFRETYLNQHKFSCFRHIYMYL